MQRPLQLVRTGAPGVPLISVAEAKQHLRVDDSDNDGLIETMAKAVEAHLDGYSGTLGRALITQSWALRTNEWPSTLDGYRLPLQPIQSVTTVKYYDPLNVQQTWANTNYFLRQDSLSPYLEWVNNVSFPDVFERDDTIEVIFKAGYGDDAASVPAAIKAGALLMLGGLYQNRESLIIGQTIMENDMVGYLLDPYRRVGL